MEQIKRSILSGIGTTLSVVGIGTGVATTTLAALHGLPVLVVAASVVAPVVCVYDVFLGNNLAMRFELKQLQEDSALRKQQLTESAAQIEEQNRLLKEQEQMMKESAEQIEQRDRQLKEQEEQIKKLYEIHAQLRQALQGLAVAGDTFNQFGYVLSGHVETLSQKIDHLQETTNNLDQTASMLSQLTQSLENHINSDESLLQTRELMFGKPEQRTEQEIKDE